MKVSPGLIGYAIGTAQILFLDWIRSRWAHARMLRFLRAELRRVKEHDVYFGLELGVEPQSDRLPRAPQLTSKFIDAVATTDFTLTDENPDDNAQQALIDLGDGCAVLAEVRARIQDLIDKAVEPGAEAERLGSLVERSNEYDRLLDRVMLMTHDGLRDLGRRLDAVRWWAQVGRLIWHPKGRPNPVPLQGDDDGRIRAFRAKHPAKRIGPDGIPR